MDPAEEELGEAAKAIVEILKASPQPLTTRQIGEAMAKRRKRCPDATIVFLNRLRRKGLIQGRRDPERRGWVWWVD